MRIAIVDDHEIFLKGLEKLLRSLDDMQIAASYTRGLPR
jgi:DNA-binding NarL/FixJ family response regulator